MQSSRKSNQQIRDAIIARLHRSNFHQLVLENRLTADKTHVRPKNLFHRHLISIDFITCVLSSQKIFPYLIHPIVLFAPFVLRKKFYHGSANFTNKVPNNYNT